MNHILTTETPAASEIMKAIEHHPHNEGMLSFVLRQILIIKHPHARTLWLPLSEESPHVPRIRKTWHALECEYPEREPLALRFAGESELQQAA